MKKLLVLLIALSLMGVMVFADPLNQPGQVIIGDEVIVIIDPADFGTVVPGSTPTVDTNVDNTGSNVDVLLDAVTLATGGNVFESLTIDGTPYATFSTVIPAFSSDVFTLAITVPEGLTPQTISDTIVYTVTGPAPV